MRHLVLVLVLVRVRGRNGFWVIWGVVVVVVVGGGELTRFGGSSWRVGLGGKRRVFWWGKERVVEGVRRGKGFGCL